VLKHRHDARGYIWNPAEFTHSFIEIETTEELIDLCDLLNQQIHLMGPNRLPDNILNRVAVNLMEIDWSKKPDVTSDFIVYAIEVDGFDFEDNLKEILPASLLSTLREKGYL
jgi:hypothetical protein